MRKRGALGFATSPVSKVAGEPYKGGKGRDLEPEKGRKKRECHWFGGGREKKLLN